MDNEIKTAPIGQAVSPDNNKPNPESKEEIQSSESSASNETTYEELAAKKGFKSPDDLAKAYIEAEKQKTRVEMGLSELIELRSHSQPKASEEEEQVQPQVETQQDAIKVVEKIVKKFTRPLEDKLALQDLLMREPDAKNFAAEMAKIIKKSPDVSWEIAYKAAKFDALQDTAVEKGRKEAYQAIQQKQAAGVAPSKPGVKEIKPLEDMIKDKSIPFSEIRKVMKERFSQ